MIRNGYAILSASAVAMLVISGCDRIWGLHHAHMDVDGGQTTSTSSGSGGHSTGGGGHSTGGHGGALPCMNGIQDGNETDKDCGGSCPPCAAGQQCSDDPDCVSNACTGGICEPECTTPPCSGDTLWAKHYGDDGTQNAWSIAVAGDDVLLTGGFLGKINFGGPPLTCGNYEDVYAARLKAASGAYAWYERYGSGGAVAYQRGTQITKDPSGDTLLAGVFNTAISFGGGTLTGAGDSDVFVTKLTTSGSHVWSKRFGDSAFQYVSAIAVDGQGNVFFGGRNEGTISLGGGDITNPTAGALGGGNIYVAKLNPAGDHVWSKGFGDGADQDLAAIAADAQGNLHILATGGGVFNFGGDPLTSAGSHDVFLAKLGADGSHIWSKSFGDAAGQQGRGVALDSHGNVLVLASGSGAINFGGEPLASAGDTDLYVAKLDPTGTHVWSHRYGYPGASVVGLAIATDGDNVFVSGSFTGQVDFGGDMLTSAGGKDVFLVKFDKNGSHVWSRRYGDAGAEQVSTSIAVAGGVFLTGHFQGSIDFGTGPMTSAGSTDVFVAKVLP